MRISIHAHGYVYDQKSGQLVVDPAILATLDGWHYEKDTLYNYLDMELIDIGVVGGIIRSTWTPESGLEVVTDYWAPHALVDSQIDALRDYTVGQLSDGIGEGGFEIALGEQALVLVPDTEEPLDVQQVDDGKQVPTPSRVARAARDGDFHFLDDAIASGEPIDSTLQGYSGLHLAILYGNVDAALALIDRGANPNLVDKDGNTPLHLCALSNSLSDNDSTTVAKALLRHGASKTITTSTGDTAADFANNRGKTAMLKVVNE